MIAELSRASYEATVAWVVMKNMKALTQDSWCPNQDSNGESFENECMALPQD
jgi:hypothetical protein